MSEVPETKSQILFEIDCWEDIISSPKWTVFMKLVKDHIVHLQNEVNEKIDTGDCKGAGEARRAMRDMNKLHVLISNRLSNLRKQSDKK